MPVVDTHAHIVPDRFPALPPGADTRGWPSLAPLDHGRAQMTIDGKPFRAIDRASFDIGARLEWMQREGIDVQVLSPLPELLGHWLSTNTAVELAKLTNTTIATAVRAAPDRLVGLGMLPWQDVALARDMVAGIATMGLKGVEVGSNIDGRSIADPVFDPVFAELARHRLALFVHGSRPPAPERILGPGIMVNVVGVPQDCASAIASFITSDVLARHPGLKLGFAHAGGTFGALLDRMDYVWREFPALHETTNCSPRDYVRRFYFDNVTYSVPYLRYLADAFGIDTLMSGSDGPTRGSQQDLAGLALEVCRGDRGEAEKMLWRNAARFLDLAL
jgi:aminocarboxymuconate-semialdehyde decarboxylase